MTTIAYKDGIIAVESQETVGDVVCSLNENKIFIEKSEDGRRFVVFVLAGDVDAIEYVREHWPTGSFPSGGCSGFVVDDGILWRGGIDDGVLVRQKHNVDTSWAFGSGRDFAIGAMDFGASAEEAVNVAIERDIYSGGEVRSYRLPAF